MEETIEIVGADHIHILDEDSMNSEGGVRLFKHAPPGIVFDHIGNSSIHHTFVYLLLIIMKMVLVGEL